MVATLRQRHGDELPAVLVTADRSSEVRQQAERLDIPVIGKPVKPAALRAVLARWHGRLSAAE